jgi:hypothetical protein
MARQNVAFTDTCEAKISREDSPVVFINSREPDGDSAGIGPVVIRRNGSLSIFELDLEDIVDIDVPNSPTDVEITNIRRQDVYCLLNLLQTLRSGVVQDLELKVVATLIGWIVDSVDVLVLSCDVESVGSSCERAVCFS